MPSPLNATSGPLTFLRGGPTAVDAAIDTHADLLSRWQTASAELGALRRVSGIGQAEPDALRTARAADAAATSEALRSGAADPGNRAVDAYRRRLDDTLRREAALRDLVEQAWSDAQSTVGQAAPVWNAELSEERAEAHQDLLAALGAVAAVLDRLDLTDSRRALVEAAGGGNLSTRVRTAPVRRPVILPTPVGMAALDVDSVLAALARYAAASAPVIEHVLETDPALGLFADQANGLVGVE